MLRVWRWYRNCLILHPVKTQVISSSLIWGFGDIAAQFITHHTAKKHQQILDQANVSISFFFILYRFLGFLLMIATWHYLGKWASFLFAFSYMDDEKGVCVNWKRVVSTSLFGFGFVGPIGHFWYEGLDRFMVSRLVLHPCSMGFVAAKVAIDGFLFGPLDLLVFFTYMGFSAGKSVHQIKEDLKRDYVPALILEGSIWPVLQVANFRFVPVRYQLLYVNIFCLLDSCLLSWIEQQQDAPWKEWFKSFLDSKDRKGQGG